MNAAQRKRLVAGAVAALLSSAAPVAAATRYVFTTFLGDSASQEKLSVYTSSDGLNFKLLSNTGYGGPTGVLRDPSIMKHTDGLYYVAYTLQSWTTDSSSFGIATSNDLEKWTFLVEVPAGIAGAHATWAPEWFKDSDGIHLIVNIEGTESGFRSYDFKAKDDTLKTWDAPAEIAIGPNNIDTFVVKAGATYHAFSKNETTKYIEHATASSFHGPWTWVGKNDWAGWGSGKEGVALYQLDDGSWRMFLDCYGNCGFLYADSKDLETWSGTKTVPGGLSGTVRHGTVLREEMGMGGMGSGGMAGDTGAPSAGRASGGAAGRGGASGGTPSDGGSGGASGGAPAETGGSGGALGGAGRGGDSNAAGGVSGAGSAGSGANGAGATGAAAAGGTTSAGGAAGSAAMGGASAGTTGVNAGAPSAADETPANGGGCGCAVPRRGASGSGLALFGVVLLGWRRSRMTRATRRA